MNPISKIVSAVALCCAVPCALASPVLTVGDVQSVEVAGPRVHIQAAHADIELTVYSPSVIRVRMDKHKLGRDFSYAVVAQPAANAANITQDDKQVLLATGALTARIGKHPFSLTFLTPDGKIINQDEAGLGTSWVGDEVTAYKQLQDGERFVGLGEKTGNLDRRGSAYTNWNTDAYLYAEGTDPLYASIPFFMGVHHGLTYGIFLDNSYQSEFNFGASNNRFASFGAQGGEMNYYFIYHAKMADIIRSYTALTGRMPLPPLWSLGYQQNRWSYFPDTEVMRIAQTLREKKIPADGITLDIHYMDGYRLFTWDKARFPDPAGMTAKLAAMGFKTTVIVDPGIKSEPGYGAYDRGMKDDVFVKYSDGIPYSAQVWPGWCYFPDFTSEKGRAWWRKEVKTYASAGVAGLWNDMNEIATTGQRIPSNLLFDFDGQSTSHKQARNVYALGMARSSYEGMKQASNQRPFILSRSGFAGLQRYSAIWTGDNTATEDHMLLGVRILNSLGMSGLSFTGMDIGGFVGAPSQSNYMRWMQIGAFTPYFRNHASQDSKASEPWTYGVNVLDVSRNFINLRYRLMPYLYGAFNDSAGDGEPVMRSLAIDYTHDDKIYDPQFQNQYLFGKAFLVAPFNSTQKFGKVYFPAGQWYRLYDDRVESGAQEKVLELSPAQLPVYVKAGSIVPMQSLVQTTAERPRDTLTLHVYRGDAGSSYAYYEDDGATFAYQKGEYFKRNIVYDPTSRRLTFGAAEGRYPSKFKQIEVVLHGFAQLQSVQVGGKARPLTSKAYTFIDPLPEVDNTNDQCKVSSFIVANESSGFAIDL